MDIKDNVSLADLTSLACGGQAKQLIQASNSDELIEFLNSRDDIGGKDTEGGLYVLGYGTNVLVSDNGLDKVLVLRGGDISFEDDLVIADGGLWWDDLVQYAVNKGLWGVELMSAVPGNVGAAVAGNIAAYGQAVADSLAWVEVYDLVSKEIGRLEAKDLGLGYRCSDFQTDRLRNKLVTKAAFSLPDKSTTELAYQSALDVASELGLNPELLYDCRQIILEARGRAGSIYVPGGDYASSAGSFFKNPLVTKEQAEHLMSFDESGKTAKQLSEQNKLHGGDDLRVSAAHVLLAAGFKRGQSWGAIRLHPKHVLKIENTGGAKAADVYSVAIDIMQTVKDKLAINLEPEVKFIGEF